MVEKILGVGYVVTDVIQGKEYLGGAAAGIAINGKNLGLDTGLLALLGGDERSKKYLLKLLEIGVDLTHLINVPEANIPKNEMNHDDRTKGWNDFGIGAFFTDIQLEKDVLANYGIVHIASAHPFLVNKVLERKLYNNLMFTYSPGPKIVNDPAFLNKDCLRASEVLFLNETEWKAIRNQLQIDTPQSLFSYGPNVVIISKGSEGISAFSQSSLGREEFLPSISWEDPETTGAGDALALGFVIGYTQHLGVATSLELGRFLSFCAIQKPGVILDESELGKFQLFLKQQGVSVQQKGKH